MGVGDVLYKIINVQDDGILGVNYIDIISFLFYVYNVDFFGYDILKLFREL